MGAVLSIRRSIACLKSYGICVVVPHGLFVVSDSEAKQLHMYSLLDGTRIRSIGSKGDGKGQFDFRNGGLCVSPDGDSVLVADARNNRVQEIQIMDGSWVRFAGVGVLRGPQYVDCNADVIVVSEGVYHRISVLSWADGSMRARFGSDGSGPGHLSWPCGVRLLADGSGVVVVDYWNDRLCVFALSGEFVAAVGNRKQGLHNPFDVYECATDGSFIVTNIEGDNFIKVSRDGVHFDVYCKQGSGDGEFNHPTALAALPNDGCLVVDSGNRRVQYLARLHARLAWMRACASRIV
jgi:DNA-binding beta-propeller fold protein YncE